MILLFYNLALLTGLVASAPWWLWRIVTTHKYREGLGERLGMVPAWLRSQSAERPVIWLHAVSVGEVLAASSLIAQLSIRAEGHRVVVSTTTRTGQKIARDAMGWAIEAARTGTSEAVAPVGVHHLHRGEWAESLTPPWNSWKARAWDSVWHARASSLKPRPFT